MNIIIKRFNKWDEGTKRKLRHATFVNGFIRKYLLVSPNGYSFVAFCDTQIMGWAYNFAIGNKNLFNIFVNPRFRNRGVATKLIELGVRKLEKIHVGHHNKASYSLFKKMKRKYPKNIIVLDWDKHWERMAKKIVLIFGKRFSFYHIMMRL